MRITPLPDARIRSTVTQNVTITPLSFVALTGQSYNLDTE